MTAADMCANAPFDDPMVSQMLDYCVSSGVMTASRRKVRMNYAGSGTLGSPASAMASSRSS